MFVAESSRGQLITAPSEQPGGIAGVTAIVFACGDCATWPEKFVGFLMKPATSADLPDDGSADLAGRFVIRKPDGDEWVIDDGEEANAIYARLREVCGNRGIKKCSP